MGFSSQSGFGGVAILDSSSQLGASACRRSSPSATRPTCRQTTSSTTGGTTRTPTSCCSTSGPSATPHLRCASAGACRTKPIVAVKSARRQLRTPPSTPCSARSGVIQGGRSRAALRRGPAPGQPAVPPGRRVAMRRRADEPALPGAGACGPARPDGGERGRPRLGAQAAPTASRAIVGCLTGPQPRRRHRHLYPAAGHYGRKTMGLAIAAAADSHPGKPVVSRNFLARRESVGPGPAPRVRRAASPRESARPALARV